jgi:ribosomal protein S18 acetylase RimI-like enzyme
MTTTLRIERATVPDLQHLVERHARFWGDRDLRDLHQLPLVHEFGDTCLVARSPSPDSDGGPLDQIVGYILGFVTPASVGYVHLIATRDDARGSGVGRRLHAAFADSARQLGALRLKAITSPANADSIAFHRAIGFDVEIVADYYGVGRPMVVFRREL